MLARVVMVFCAVWVACSARTEALPPQAIAWNLANNASLAYRFTADATAIVDGIPEAARHLSGFIFVDVDGRGDATIRVEAGQGILGNRVFELQKSSSNFFFPLPGASIGTTPIEQSFVVKGLGTTVARSNPDIQVVETLTRASASSTTVRLAFARTGTAIGPARVHVELKDNGEGAFSLSLGRYESLQRTTTMRVDGEGIRGNSQTMLVTVRSRLAYDSGRSRSRSQKLARHGGASVSSVELARYLAANTSAAEIDAAVRRLNGGRPSAKLLFHLKAAPVSTWRKAMSLPTERREAFVLAASSRFGHGNRLPAPLLAWFIRELPHYPVLAAAVASIPDERVRPQLERIVSRSGSAPGGNAKWNEIRARASLATLAAQKVGPKALLSAEGKSFVRIGHALQADGQDKRALVPVLVEILKRANTSPSTARTAGVDLGDVCVQWLEGITGRSFGKDVGAWHRYWTANRSKSYCQWMVDAAGQKNLLLASRALARLASCADHPGASDLLAKRAEGREPISRRIATLALAQHTDKRALPRLLTLLASASETDRATAFIALANFHDTTLGYEPNADNVSRDAALRRWRAWANRPR